MIRTSLKTDIVSRNIYTAVTVSMWIVWITPKPAQNAQFWRGTAMWKNEEKTLLFHNYPFLISSDSSSIVRFSA